MNRKKMLKRRLFAGLGGLAILIAACGSPEEASKPSSVAMTTGLWSNPKAIPVCWMQSGSAVEPFQQQIKAAVTQDFRRAGIEFTGWQNCNVEDLQRTMIRVELRSSMSQSGGSVLGCSVVGKTRGSVGCGAQIRGSTMWIAYNSRSIARTAIHEFGHAVGLLHEHQRADRSDCNITEAVLYPSTFREFLTIYDPNSIMSYCSPAQRLSVLDVQGLQKLYQTNGTVSEPQDPESPAPPDTPNTPAQICERDIVRTTVTNTCLAPGEGKENLSNPYRSCYDQIVSSLKLSCR